MKGTPPVTLEEQDKCFRSKSCCWRLAEKKNTHAEKKPDNEETPLHTM
jgi:hypothetical protein